VRVWRPGDPYITPPQPLGWIVLSHVSTSIRSILIGDPSLWFDIIFSLSSLDAKTTFLARSAPLPVTFDLMHLLPTCSHTEEDIALLSRNFARAREIKVDCIYESDLDHWPFDPIFFSNRDFPSLEILELELDAMRGGEGWERVTYEAFSLPPLIAPRLRKLCLTDFWVPFCGSSLVELELKRSGDDEWYSFPRPQAAALLSMLKGCANLRRLVLSGWVSEIEQTPASTVVLQHLQSFEIEDQYSRAFAFWTHLTIPSSANLKFTLFRVSKATSNGSKMSSFGRRVLNIFGGFVHSASISPSPHLTNSGFVKMWVSGSSEAPSLEYRDWPGDCDSDPMPGWIGFFLHLTGGDTDDDQDDQEAAEQHESVAQLNDDDDEDWGLQASLALGVRAFQLSSSLRRLKIDLSGREPLTPELLRSILQQLCLLEMLFLVGDYGYGADVLCTAVLQPPNKPTPTSPFLPNLTHFGVDCIDFAESQGRRERYHKFLEMLGHRARLRCTLQVLKVRKIICWDLQAGQDVVLPALRKLVPDVSCYEIQDRDGLRKYQAWLREMQYGYAF